MTLHRSLADLTRWARLAEALGGLQQGHALSTRTLADLTGETLESVTEILECWDHIGWVREARGAAGHRTWSGTRLLPPVAPMEAPDIVVMATLMSAALAVNRRGVLA